MCVCVYSFLSHTHTRDFLSNIHLFFSLSLSLSTLNSLDCPERIQDTVSCSLLKNNRLSRKCSRTLLYTLEHFHPLYYYVFCIPIRVLFPTTTLKKGKEKEEEKKTPPLWKKKKLMIMIKKKKTRIHTQVQYRRQYSLTVAALR